MFKIKLNNKGRIERSRNRILICSIVLMSAAACFPSNKEGHSVTADKRPKTSLSTKKEIKTTWYDPKVIQYDFGLLLAGSETKLVHTYKLTNISFKGVRILGVENRKPCCGEVATVEPQTLEHGQALEVPVTLKLGVGSGEVLRHAVLQVDGNDNSISLITRATSQSRIAMIAVQPEIDLLNLGETRSVEYFVYSYGTQSIPCLNLDDMEIRSELPTKWVDKVERLGTSGRHIFEHRRRLAVTLPAASEPGRRSYMLFIQDHAGLIVGRQQIVWTVLNQLETTPTGLIFAANSAIGDHKQVVLRSRDDEPFKILGTESSLTNISIETDQLQKTTHRIKVANFNDTSLNAKIGELKIRTNHPKQPNVTISVYVTGRDGRAAPPEVHGDAL